MVINVLENATETYDKMREGSSLKQFLSPKILSSGNNGFALHVRLCLTALEKNVL